MWGGGPRNDVLRNLYFRPNGSFRRYGRIALLRPSPRGPLPCTGC